MCGDTAPAAFWRETVAATARPLLHNAPMGLLLVFGALAACIQSATPHLPTGSSQPRGPRRSVESMEQVSTGSVEPLRPYELSHSVAKMPNHVRW